MDGMLLHYACSHASNKSLDSPWADKTTLVMWQLDLTQILFLLWNKDVLLLIKRGSS